MDAELIGKFITQQVAVTMAEKTKQYEKKIKKSEKGGREKSVGRVIIKKQYEGRWMRLQEKQKIRDPNEYQVKTTTEICVSIGTRPK